MALPVNFCSFNIKGCKNPVKRNRIITFLRKENVSVAMLQETHLTENEHKKLRKDWVGHMYSSTFNSKSRGVAILVHKKLPININHVEIDERGCYVLLHGVLYGEKVTILNVYAAPDLDPTFFTKLTDLLFKYHCPYMIVGGDWNCVMNNILDKRPTITSAKQTPRQRALQQMVDEVDLVDVWRHMHPGEKDYTFFFKSS